MNAKTLKALKASIDKWQRNVKAEAPDMVFTGSDDCPLCKLFWSGEADQSCIGCPVMGRTGKLYCEKTPHDKAWMAHRNWLMGEGSKDAFRKTARAEVKFLKSLLPAES